MSDLESGYSPMGVEETQSTRSRKGFVLKTGVVLLIAAVVGLSVFAAVRSSESVSNASKSMEDLTPLAKASSGSMVVYGRTINYKVSAYLRGFVLRYKADATDVATGIRGHASGLKSGKGAVEHAVEDLFRLLIAGGHIPAGKEVSLKSAVPRALVKSGLLGVSLLEQPETVVSDTALVFEIKPEDMDDKDAKEIDLVGSSCKSSTIEVYGRVVEVRACAYRKGLKIRYRGEAKDRATGIIGRASGLKSGKGAAEHAVQDLFKNLIEAGHVVPPTEQPMLTLENGEGPSAYDEDKMLTGTCKSGQTNVYGREIHFKACGSLKGFVWRYTGDATDLATGIRGRASGLKSGQGAVEHAIEDLFRNLMAAGVIPAPKELDTAENAIDAVFVAVEPQLEADEEAPGLQGLFCKKTDKDIYGRKIKIEVCGGLKGLKWRYKGTAKDVASGVSASSSGHKSGNGAGETAVKKLFEELIRRGIIPAGKQVDVTLTDVNVDYIDGPVNEMDEDYDEDYAIPEEVTYEDEDEDEVMNRADPPLPLGGPFSKSGDITVYGRVIHYKAKGYITKLKWRYKADCTDKATGISAHSSGHKSGEGAIKGATEKVFQQLAAHGHI